MTEEKRTETRSVPPGGPATINGVLYQLLWSLLRASRARFVNQPLLVEDQIEEVTLLVEPAGGGGDLVLQAGEKRCVEQIKARPDGGTWSYRQVIETVIPDLYLAIDGNPFEAEYRFVTEGRMGRWQEAYRFFQALKSRPCPEDDPLSDLADKTPLKLAGKGSGEERTERALFKEVVAEVRKRSRVHENEDEVTTQRRLRTLLANFEFVGGQKMEAVQREIDSHLMAIVDRNDDLSRIRDALALALARRATEGHAEVQCGEFFREHGLNAVPLSDWATLRDRTHRLIQSELRIRGYDPTLDVRPAAAERLWAEWPTATPMLAITGESGVGKTWRAYAMALSCQQRVPLCVLADAGPTIDATLERISALVWQEVAGHDAAIPVSQIAQRIRQTVGGKVSPWLTVVLEKMVTQEQAIILVQQRWEDWGVRIVMTVSPNVATVLEKESQGRCDVSRVDDFTTGELQFYLEAFLGDAWPSMPEFVRNPLRKPLMADIYRQIVESRPERVWSPQTEYELFSAFWDRIGEREPMDRLILIQLAERFLNDERYPWSDRDVAEAGADNEAVKRLEALGWLRKTGRYFDMPHDRLLNWACAHALLSRFEHGETDAGSLSRKLKELLGGRSGRYGNRLGFVPMDFLSLLCQDGQLQHHLPEIISGLEGHHRQNKVLYTELIPSLGPAVIEALSIRLRAGIDDLFLSGMITKAIRRVGGPMAVSLAMSMLDDANPLLQRQACSILTKCPISGALDQLWGLHNAAQREPSPFLRPDERARRYLLYDETLPALRECCRLDPDWLSSTITECNPETEAVADLAYLLANMEGEAGADLWRQQKRTLFDRIPVEKRRALATCIDRFADRDEIPWLIESIGERGDLLGARAFAALARLAPERAVGELHRLPKDELSVARSWFIDYLFAVVAEPTRECRAAQPADSWHAESHLYLFPSLSRMR